MKKSSIALLVIIAIGAAVLLSGIYFKSGTLLFVSLFSIPAFMLLLIWKVMNGMRDENGELRSEDGPAVGAIGIVGLLVTFGLFLLAGHGMQSLAAYLKIVMP